MAVKKNKKTYTVGKDGHIIISYDDFDTLCEKIADMDMKAEEYMPEEEEFEEIEKNFPEFFKLLIWIDSTGEVTEDNKEMRRKIKDIINRNIDFVDNEEEN